MNDITLTTEFYALLAKKVFIEVRPIDDWDCWTYRVVLPDCMAPMFDASTSVNEYKSHQEALEAGIIDYYKNFAQ